MTEFSTIRLSTDDFPAHERLPVLREVWSKIVRFDLEPMSDAPLSWTMNARVLPDLVVSEFAGSSLRGRRTRALTADGNDNVALSCSPYADSNVAYRGREFTHAVGAGAVFSLSDPFACASPNGTARCVAVSLPRNAIAERVPGLEDKFGSLLPPDSEPLLLLNGYVATLTQHPPTTSELRRLVANHIHDLVVLALGPSRDVAEIANARGVRAARLRAVKADILRNLARPDFSVRGIARRHGVTPRYVQKLFESEGITFSEFLRDQRLARAHHMLTSRRFLGRSISDIAFEAGFGDLSHFNRNFRRRYSESPSDVRAAARRDKGI